MRYHFMFIFLSLYDGFLIIADAEDNKIVIDPCEPNPCQNGGSCYKSDTEEEFTCFCLDGFTGNLCENNPCKPNPCQNGGSCTVSRTTEGFSCDCPVGYSGDICDFDPCILCEEDEICVIENGSRDCQKKQKIIDEKDLCSEHLCLNDGNCLIENGVPKCNCSGPFSGEKCEQGLCDPNPCKNFGRCDVNGSGFICECIVGYIGDTCEQSEYDTSENPSTTMNISISSATTTTSQTAKSDTTTVSGKTLKTTINEISKKDELSNISTTVVKSSSAFTKLPNKITESTKRVGTTIKVSSTDLSTTLIGISSETNTGDYHTTSPSFVKTSTFNDNKVETSDTSTNTIVTTTPTIEMSSKETEQTINGIITLNFTSTKYTEGTTFVEDTDKTFPITSRTTVSTTTTVKTPTKESDQLLNRTVTGDITTDVYNTTENVLFQSSSQSSLQINSESSASTSSISESYSEINIKITSKKPQTEIAAFTKTKETTESVDVKSTPTFVSTTETSNSTKVINKSNKSSQNITTYVSIGVACFAAVIAFAAGGWYVKRKCRRRNHQYYRDCDSSSEISGSSESNHSYA